MTATSSEAAGFEARVTEPPIARGGARSVVGGLDLVFFSFGSFASAFAYASLQPILLAVLLFTAGLGLLALPWLGGHHEQRIFVRTFSVAWLMSGVAALYATMLADPAQLRGDAASFFEMASGQARALTLEDLRVLHEGALAIVLWGAIYDVLAAIGFARERFVGVLINVVAVALTGVVALKMARRIYGEDPYRFRRLTLLVSGCGLFWLFAGLHLRDAVVLLFITAIAYTWMIFLSDPRLGRRFWLVVVSSAVGVMFLAFLRGEFAFVPIAMAGAGTAALLFGRKTDRSAVSAYAFVAIGVVIFGMMVLAHAEMMRFVLGTAQEGYRELAAEQHGSGSLGMAVIVDQPLPVRLVLGSIYLFVFPIPFWAGFEIPSAYDAFKSFNVIFFYFVIPLLVLGVGSLIGNAEVRKPTLLFMLFASLGFTLAIAGTSLETRHFGSFLPLMFMVALLPDLRSRSVWARYKLLLLGLFCAVAAVHGSWVLLKIL